MIIKNIRFVDSEEKELLVNIKTENFDVKKVEISCFRVVSYCLEIRLVTENEYLIFISYTPFEKSWKFRKLLSMNFILNLIFSKYSVFVSYKKEHYKSLNYYTVNKQEILL
jgi:hypothetical protein